MPFNNIVSRTDAAALIPEQVAGTVLTRATEESAAMRLFGRIPVGGSQVRVPVLSALPVAYWVTGDTGLKQTSELAWGSKFLNVEELAVIVPVPQNVLDDVNYDIWGEAQPLLSEAIGRALAAAIFFGTNAPSTFPSDVSTASSAAGNTVAESAAAAAGGFFADVDNLISLVETDGFDVTGFVAARSARGRFRLARNTQGERLDAGRLNGALTDMDGTPIVYPMRGMFPTTTRMFAGDWTQFVLGIRKDITFEVAREAVIQDNTGAIVYNLFQQDMVAMRVTFRAGWQVANVISFDQPVEANRYPAARLTFT